MTRLVAVCGLLVLGAAALARLPLDYLPRQSFPELTVELALGERADPAQVTREWVVPIESALRSVGRLRGLAGEVRADGASLTARFVPGTDPERKAARLESELAGLERRLPEGAGLSITPASGSEGDLLAIVWLSGVRDDGDAEAAAEEVRAIPGVRAAELFGSGAEEVRVELRSAALDPWGTVDRIRREIDRALSVPSLGQARQGDRILPVVAQPRGERFESLPVAAGRGALPLGGLATVRTRRAPPQVAVRFEGEPSRALFVWRTHGAPLLGMDRALRRHLDHLPGGIRGTVGWGAAEPLRSLVLRLGAAGLLSALAAALLGARLAGRLGAVFLGLAVPAALAAAANAFWLAGVELNVTTLVALALAIAASLPAAALRLTRRGGFAAYAATAVAAAAAAPVAVSLASQELGPLLTEPARALLLATAASLAAVALLPSAPRRRAPGRRGFSSILRSALRDPGTVVLATATAVCLSLMLFGGALVPAPGSLEADRQDLRLTLRLPEGTPLAEAGQRMRQLEESLARAEEVERFWTRAQTGGGLAVAEVRAADRRPDRLLRLTTRLRYELAAVGALEIQAGTSRGGTGFATRLEDRPLADEEGMIYRVLLRGADLSALRAGYDRVRQRLDAFELPAPWVTGWEAPSVRVSLRPAPGTTTAEAEELAWLLRQASSPPSSRPLPGPGERQRRLTVVPAGLPEEPVRVPQMAELLGRPVRLRGGREVTPAALLIPVEEAEHFRITREAGRFLVPVEIRLNLNSEEARLELRRRIDQAFARLPLPPGCDLERPPLTPALWQAERLRLIGLALAIPLLLFGLAAVRTGSPLRALAALAPLTVGLLAALPWIRQSLGQVDELTVFALAAVIAGVLPAGAEALPAGRLTSVRGARLYRRARRQAPWLLGAAPVLLVGLAAATLGADSTRSPWAVPLQAAALAGSTALAASALLAPAFRLFSEKSAERGRRQGREEVRRRRHPPAWNEPGRPVLEARSLLRVYGGRTRALSGVSFELTPGITGLLGPNGAGKTTLLRILTGLLAPTRGAVLFRGVPVTTENLAEYRQVVGFLPQDFNAYPGFTAEQFLEHWALERGMADRRRRAEEIERLLAAVGLAEHAGRKVRDFSGGMRQRVGIARALLGAPPVLIVDEPTTGLDIESRSRFRQILLETAGERIVLFSTHIASDVEAAARRILLLHRGVLRFDGPPEALVARARGRVFRTLVGDADLAELGRRFRITARVRVLEGIQVRGITRPGEALPGEEVEPDLEEAYLAEVDLATGPG